MKVLLVNGSPHEKGTTYGALSVVKNILQENGVEAEIFWLGNKPISGCMGCGACAKLGKCVIDDCVNVFLEKSREADGFIFASPVHYAAASGSITSFMDRLFYGRSAIFCGKPAASVVCARRAGTTAALDQLNKYYSISGMPQVPSQYWNMVHGTKAEDIEKDEEGMQILRSLGRNMAWLLGCIEAGKQAGITYPEREAQIRTNFVR
ncbi:MAG: flavodoxin family protein [Clostridia bacterium]|nr:flavodoxin family protein [Clostridia bacterium]